MSLTGDRIVQTERKSASRSAPQLHQRRPRFQRMELHPLAVTCPDRAVARRPQRQSRETCRPVRGVRVLRSHGRAPSARLLAAGRVPGWWTCCSCKLELVRLELYKVRFGLIESGPAIRGFLLSVIGITRVYDSLCFCVTTVGNLSACGRPFSASFARSTFFSLPPCHRTVTLSVSSRLQLSLRNCRVH